MSHGPYLRHHAPLRVPHSAVFGRLARPWLLVSGSRAGEGLSSVALPGARGPGEPLQELSRSFTDFRLSGDESSNSSFEGFPDLKASSEALLSAARVCVLSAAAAKAVLSTSRGNVVPVFHCSGFSAADARSSTPPVVTFRLQPPCLGTILASGIFGGGPSNPISLSVSPWVFRLLSWPCTPMPWIPVGAPFFWTTICPACGLRVVHPFRPTTESSLRYSTASKVSYQFFKDTRCLCLPTTPPLCHTCGNKGAHMPRRSMR